jgi:hypothetical protein
LTVIRFGGKARPSAARTRSRDTATALSGSPTTVKAGSPEAVGGRRLGLELNDDLDAVEGDRSNPGDHAPTAGCAGVECRGEPAAMPAPRRFVLFRAYDPFGAQPRRQRVDNGKPAAQFAVIGLGRRIRRRIAEIEAQGIIQLSASRQRDRRFRKNGCGSPPSCMREWIMAPRRARLPLPTEP